MAKVKRIAPTSIRLKPDSEKWVADIQRATGWSLSRVLDHCVRVAIRVQLQDTAGIRMYRNMLKVSAEQYALITAAERKAAAARGEIRKATAAVKELT
jgi:hypothetical protein